VGIDAGEGFKNYITSVRAFPRLATEGKTELYNAIIEARNDGGEWTTLHTFEK